MKSHLLRPWVSGIVLLAAISAVALMWVGAQTTPPPVLPPTVEPQTQVTPAATPAAPKVESKSAATDAVAKPNQSWGVSVSSSAYYIEKMKRITFPTVQLTEASMEDVIDLLRTMSRDHDTSESDPAKKGVNLILKPGADTSKATITLDLREVPMSEVLKYATEQAGMKYKVEPYAVIVIPFSEWNTETYIRTFRVPPDFLTSTTGGANQTAMDFLKALGIPFPDGASASFVPGTTLLTVRNTQQNLEMLQMMFEALQGDKQVAVWEGASYYAQKLNTITVPVIQFPGTTVKDAVVRLHDMSRNYDTLEKDPSKMGVNFVLRPEAAASTTPITLDLKDVPMSEALKYVTELAGMKYKIEPYAVVILSQSNWTTERYTHIFKVPPNFVSSNGGGPGSTASDVLIAQGVQINKGDSASFLPDASLMMVRTSLPSLYEVEALVESSMARSLAAPTTVKPQTPQAAIPGLPGAPGGGLVLSTPVPTQTITIPPQFVEVHGGQLVSPQPSGDIFFVGTSATGSSGMGEASASPHTRAQQLLRDTELKVLLRHFETTVSEIADGEKALLVEPDAAKRATLDTKLNALRGWKAKLVANINGLTGAASGSAMEQKIKVYPRASKVPAKPSTTPPATPQR